MVRFMKPGSLFSGSAIYLISNICNAAIPFALLPILTRYLTQEEYGQVAMFQTLLGALSAFVGVNVAGAAVRKYYDNPSTNSNSELKEYISSCLIILFVSALICLALMSSVNVQLSRWLGVPSDWLFFSVIVSASLVVVNLRLGQWQVRKLALRYGFFQVSQSLLDILLSLFFVLILFHGGEGRIQAQMAASTVFAIVAILLLFKDGLLTLPRQWSKHSLEALRFGVPLVPHVAGGFLLASVDRFVINDNLGLAQAGIYMVAVQLSMGMLLVFDALNKAYVPWLFERLGRDRHEEKKQIVCLTYAWYVIILLAVALAFLIGPYVVSVIAGEDYKDAGRLIGWLVLGQGFTGMYLMVTNYVFYSKRTGTLSVVTFSAGLLNVILLYFLIPPLGLFGAAIAFCIANASRFLLTWWLAHKQHPMPWFSCLSRS